MMADIAGNEYLEYGEFRTLIEEEEERIVHISYAHLPQGVRYFLINRPISVVTGSCKDYGTPCRLEEATAVC